MSAISQVNEEVSTNQTGEICDCLLCYSADANELKSFSSHEDLLFVLNKVLQVSKSTFTLLPERLGDTEGDLLASPLGSALPQIPGNLELRVCECCKLEIDGAKRIYKELLVAVQQFKEIQRRLWRRINSGACKNQTEREGRQEDNRRSRSLNWVERCRHLIANGGYLETDPFVIDDFEVCASNSLASQRPPVPAKEDDVKDEILSEILSELDETGIFDHLGNGPTSLESSSELNSGGDDARQTSGEGRDEHVDETHDSLANDDDNLSDLSIKREVDSEDEKNEEDASWSATEMVEEDDDEGSSGSESEEDEDWTESGSKTKTKSDDKPSERNASTMKCDICSFTTKSFRGLKVHISIKHNKPGVWKRRISEVRNHNPPPAVPKVESKHKCPEPGCGKTFSRPFILRAHISRHTRQPQFKCSICPEMFYDAKSLKIHRNNYHPESIPPEANPKRESIPCDLCSRILSTSSGLVKHRHLIHNIPPPAPPTEFKCSEEGCERVFPRRQQLRDHLSKCHGQEPNHKCTKCGAAFHTWKQKWRHDHKVHRDGLAQKSFVCEICGKGLACLDYLLTHKSKKHPEKVVPKNWKNRPQKKQPEDSRVICELCGKSVKLSSLKNHMMVVHDKDKLKFACHLCDNRFVTARFLKEHLFHSHQVGPEENRRKRTKQQGELFQCPVAGCRLRFYGDKGKLDTHMEEVHGPDGKKPGKYKCRYCGKTFHLKIKYRYHEMIHENKETRPFICDICQKGFANPNNLCFHRKYTHKIEFGRRGQRLKMENQNPN